MWRESGKTLVKAHEHYKEVSLLKPCSGLELVVTNSMKRNSSCHCSDKEPVLVRALWIHAI
jgi:hypothetical protein